MGLIIVQMFIKFFFGVRRGASQAMKESLENDVHRVDLELVLKFGSCV